MKFHKFLNYLHTGTGNMTENHVEAQNSHQSKQNNSNKLNNKKHYNNIYYKYHKGKRSH